MSVDNIQQEEKLMNEEQELNNATEAATPEVEELVIEEAAPEVEIEDPIVVLQREKEALQNDYLRLMADFDNFRKRTLREKAELLKNGGENALKQILPVVDDFERAMMAMSTAQDVESVKEGVELIYQKFQGYLTANGVTEIEAVGQKFDTEVHEAITTFPAPTPEQKGMVIDCMTKGYKLNDKVIRFSQVVVGE